MCSEEEKTYFRTSDKEGKGMVEKPFALSGASSVSDRRLMKPLRGRKVSPPFLSPLWLMFWDVLEVKRKTRSCHTSVLCDAFCREWTNSTTMQAAIFTKAKTFTSGKTRNEESIMDTIVWRCRACDHHIQLIFTYVKLIWDHCLLFTPRPIAIQYIPVSIRKVTSFVALIISITLFPGCIPDQIYHKEISMHRVTIPAFTAKDFDKHTWCNSTFHDQSWNSSFSFFFDISSLNYRHAFCAYRGVDCSLFCQTIKHFVSEFSDWVCDGVHCIWYRCYSINIFLCHIIVVPVLIAMNFSLHQSRFGIPVKLSQKAKCQPGKIGLLLPRLL